MKSYRIEIVADASAVTSVTSNKLTDANWGPNELKNTTSNEASPVIASKIAGLKLSPTKSGSSKAKPVSATKKV